MEDATGDNIPSHNAHKAIDVLLFGKEYPHIHKEIDMYDKQLGIFHRLLGHSPIDAINSSEPKVAMIHHISDFILTPLMPIVEPDETIIFLTKRV